MSVKTNAYANALLNHVLNNVDMPNIGDAAGLQNSAAAGNFYLSLHTADPGAAGTQTTSEVSYTGYARVAISRSGAAWTVTGPIAENASLITFPACAGGSGTATYVGIGTDSSGTGNLLYRAVVITPSGGLAISAGITPQIQPAAAIVVEA